MSERARNARCAIYTRKSTEEGLEQAFNSLHAQREACEAYIKSQKHEGWSVLPTVYDDGGFSGGSMDRPALQRLLQDVRDSKADVVVVYKIDRLTRSLFDFAKIVEILDAASASFVSVTQSFNTTSSMGRLTLNVLLSFAQFEREVTGERIRDKIAASKRKGMFMGGNVPLGYDLDDHQLVINASEAATVRAIFDLYIRLRTVRAVKHELDRTDARTKVRERQGAGGGSFGVGHLYYILNNPLYIGKIRHRQAVHDGRHEPIIPSATWEAVQSTLAANAVERGEQIRSGPNQLVGKVFDGDGRRMTPTASRKGVKQYRYYAVAAAAGEQPLRVPASDLETAVKQTLGQWLKDYGNVAALVDGSSPPFATYERARQLADELAAGNQMVSTTVRDLVDRVVCHPSALQIRVSATDLLARLGVPSAAPKAVAGITIEQPCSLARRGKGQRLIVGSSASQPTAPDKSLAAAILRARTWFETLKTRQVGSIADLAAVHDLTRGYISQQLPLAFLAPDIVEIVAAGRQPASWTLDRLIAVATASPDWTKQRAALA